MTHGRQRLFDEERNIARLREGFRRTLAGLHLELADDLAGILNRKVDLVVLNHAPVDLTHRILRDGMLLLDLDPAARIRFEVLVRNQCFDLLPHLRRCHRIEGGRAA